MAALSGLADTPLQGTGPALLGESAGRSYAAAGSYESFVREQTPRLLQCLSLITHDRETAADAAQDAFLQLYRHWDEMEAIRDPVAWLYRVALNRSTDYRRRLARNARLIERLFRSAEPDWVAPAAVDTQLVAAFRSLPRGQRMAATLYYLADLPIAEIARVMQVSEGTVNTHLHRAREALKVTLEAD